MFERDTERIALVQEWFGLLLVHDTSLQKCLLLVGDGGNGKTVLLLVLIALLGEDNVSHVPLELFGERFQLTATLGKLANIVAEIGPMNRVAEGQFKQFVGGDAMHFDRKNRSPIRACPTARLVLATNALPPFVDPSEGPWRRLMVLPCNVVIPPEQQDRHLPDKLKTELSGIFTWAIKGLRRLRANNRFTNPTVCQQALEAYRSDANPARIFLREQVEPARFGRLECAQLYQAYRYWCETSGYAPRNEAQFGKEVARVFPSVRRVRSIGPNGTRPWVYEGIQLRSTGPVGVGRPIVVVSPVTVPSQTS